MYIATRQLYTLLLNKAFYKDYRRLNLVVVRLVVVRSTIVAPITVELVRLVSNE